MPLGSELMQQAELFIRQRTIELVELREKTRKEVEADSAKRGMLRSGSHVSALVGRYGKLLESHGLGLADELTALFEEFDSLTKENGDWVVQRLAKHLGK